MHAGKRKFRSVYICMHACMHVCMVVGMHSPLQWLIGSLLRDVKNAELKQYEQSVLKLALIAGSVGTSINLLNSFRSSRVDDDVH